mmetsp:Transcript_19953/g.60422  ORF Transcript_19953/g.60422 Transcript_19953/m.60422 type:complete len:248 (-) Transcript_19953:36-779(-)
MVVALVRGEALLEAHACEGRSRGFFCRGSVVAARASGAGGRGARGRGSAVAARASADGAHGSAVAAARAGAVEERHRRCRRRSRGGAAARALVCHGRGLGEAVIAAVGVGRVEALEVVRLAEQRRAARHRVGLQRELAAAVLAAEVGAADELALDGDLTVGRVQPLVALPAAVPAGESGGGIVSDATVLRLRLQQLETAPPRHADVVRGSGPLKRRCLKRGGAARAAECVDAAAVRSLDAQRNEMPW